MQLSKGTLLIGMSGPGWSLDPAGVYSMGLVVDGEFVRRARGVVLAGMHETMFIDLGRDQAARALLRRDARSSLADGMRSYDFHLTGAAEALARLDQCVSAGGRGRWTKSEFGGRLPPVLHCCQEGPIGRWPI
jgi:hypothetical protein